MSRPLPPDVETELRLGAGLLCASCRGTGRAGNPHGLPKAMREPCEACRGIGRRMPGKNAKTHCPGKPAPGITACGLWMSSVLMVRSKTQLPTCRACRKARTEGRTP